MRASTNTYDNRVPCSNFRPGKIAAIRSFDVCKQPIFFRPAVLASSHTTQGMQMSNLNVYCWIRDSVRRAVSPCFSDAVDQIVRWKETKNINPHLLTLLKQNPATNAVASESSGASVAVAEEPTGAKPRRRWWVARSTISAATRASRTIGDCVHPIVRRRGSPAARLAIPTRSASAGRRCKSRGRSGAK